jgi:hypothetical protein
MCGIVVFGRRGYDGEGRMWDKLCCGGVVFRIDVGKGREVSMEVVCDTQFTTEFHHLHCRR